MTNKQFVRFEKFLKQKELKMTTERRLIVEEIARRKNHFQIEDLIRFFENSNERVSRATIYRTLKLLEEAGILKSFPLENETRLYEPVKNHHDHLICTECGKIIEFMNKEIETQQKEICSQSGFEAQYHILNIYGICEECRRKKK